MVDSATFAPAACPGNRNRINHSPPSRKTSRALICIEVSGTLVGFRFPEFTEGINVPGYHLHFLSEDHRAGGHVLALELERGRLAIDDTSNFHIELPTDGAFLAAELGGDRVEDVKKVEK